MSFYPWSWLHRNSYDPPLNKGQTSNEWISSSILLLFPCTKLRNILSKVLWGSKIIKSPPTVAYGKVMSEDLGLFEWLSNVVSRWPHNSLVAHIVTLSHRINLDSPSYPVYLQLQKPRKNFPNGLALLERRNVRTFIYWLNQPSFKLKVYRWTILGIHFWPIKRRYSLHISRPWSTYWQHIFRSSIRSQNKIEKWLDFLIMTFFSDWPLWFTTLPSPFTHERVWWCYTSRWWFLRCVHS